MNEITARDEWIIDGHYRDVRHLIWGRSQTVIWLNYPPLFVGWRLIRRKLRKKLARLENKSSLQAKPGDGKEQEQIAGASWSKRIFRITKMLREHREYGLLLQQSHYPQTQIIEIVSLHQTRQWEAVFAGRTASAQPSRAALANISRNSAKPVPTFIELFGLPGAGKTTLINAIDEDPDMKTRLAIAEEWGRLSFLRRLGFFIRTLLDLPLVGSAIYLAFTARLTRGESLWRLLRLIIMKHWWLSRSGILLFDQGALQSIWSILYVSGRTVPDPKMITPLIRYLFEGMQTQVIAINVDKATAASRIVGRTDGTSRFDGLAFDDIESKIERSISLIDAIVAATRAAGIDVQTFAGSEPVPVLAGQLQQLLNRYKRDQSGSVGELPAAAGTAPPSSDSIISR